MEKTLPIQKAEKEKHNQGSKIVKKEKKEKPEKVEKPKKIEKVKKVKVGEKKL